MSSLFDAARKICLEYNTVSASQWKKKITLKASSKGEKNVLFLKHVDHQKKMYSMCKYFSWQAVQAKPNKSDFFQTMREEEIESKPHKPCCWRCSYSIEILQGREGDCMQASSALTEHPTFG